MKTVSARDRLPISAFVICLNEVEVIGNCIESLQQCAEIVMVDSGSTDGTVELIQSYIDTGWPIKLIHNAWPGFSAQKQFALEQCTQAWCLSIDSDERLDQQLQQSLAKLIDAPDDVAGFRFTRRPYLIGYGYVPLGVHEGRLLRLIRNGRGAFDLSLKVHEGIIAEGQVCDTKMGTLLHYNPMKINKQISKENKYAELKTAQLIEKNAKTRTLRLIFNPPIYFLRLYFMNGLWKCRLPGFICAMTGFVYSFLTEANYYQTRSLAAHAVYDDLEKTASFQEPEAEMRRAA